VPRGCDSSRATVRCGSARSRCTVHPWTLWLPAAGPL
jgi:hypothetical protein